MNPLEQSLSRLGLQCRKTKPLQLLFASPSRLSTRYFASRPPSFHRGAQPIRKFSDYAGEHGVKSRRGGRVLLVAALVGCGVIMYYNATERKIGYWEQILTAIPSRWLSRAWGEVHQKTLPVWARSPLYHLWTYLFGVNLDEVELPLEDYVNLAAFFTRKLKPHVRPIDKRSTMVSPVDGKVVMVGAVVDGQLEQIKGLSYSLQEFLGISSTASIPRNLHYCVLYLAPGDYHRIHSPVNGTLASAKHFAGELFPVHPFVLQKIPSLFTKNERVVLEGEWRDGFFVMAAVGAYNVGNIEINHLPSLKTNESDSILQVGREFPLQATPLSRITKGDQVACFNLGSTVVLIFEVKDKVGQTNRSDPRWTINVNDVVKVGQPLLAAD